MNDKLLVPADASHEQIEMIIGALYMTLAYAFRHIAEAEGPACANTFKNELVAALKRGDFNVAA